MTTTEGLLVAFIVVLFAYIIMGRRSNDPGQKVFDCVDRGTGAISTVKMQYTPEAKASSENIESFDGGSAYQRECDGDLDFANNAYGAPDMEFKDWAASMAIDKEVVKNHAEYVKDRYNSKTQNITGRTYSPDSHESYDPIKWIGLRRPQAVPVDNPTQVPDVDKSLYERKSTFTWGH